MKVYTLEHKEIIEVINNINENYWTIVAGIYKDCIIRKCNCVELNTEYSLPDELFKI